MASKKQDHESMHGTQSVIYKSVRYTFNCSRDNKKIWPRKWRFLDKVFRRLIKQYQNLKIHCFKLAQTFMKQGIWKLLYNLYELVNKTLGNPQSGGHVSTFSVLRNVLNLKEWRIQMAFRSHWSIYGIQLIQQTLLTARTRERMTP